MVVRKQPRAHHRLSLPCTDVHVTIKQVRSDLTGINLSFHLVFFPLLLLPLPLACAFAARLSFFRRASTSFTCSNVGKCNHTPSCNAYPARSLGTARLHNSAFCFVTHDIDLPTCIVGRADADKRRTYFARLVNLVYILHCMLHSFKFLSLGHVWVRRKCGSLLFGDFQLVHCAPSLPGSSFCNLMFTMKREE
jgi:hypothetical protein